MTKSVLSPFCPVASSCFARETQQHPLSHFANPCIEPCTPQGGLVSEEVVRCWRRPSGSRTTWFAFAEFLRGSTGSRRAGRHRESRGARCTCSARSVNKTFKESQKSKHSTHPGPHGETAGESNQVLGQSDGFNFPNGCDWSWGWEAYFMSYFAFQLYPIWSIRKRDGSGDE